MITNHLLRINTSYLNYLILFKIVETKNLKIPAYSQKYLYHKYPSDLMSDTEPLMPEAGIGRLVWGKSPKQWATYPQSLRVAASGHPSFLHLFFERFDLVEKLFVALKIPVNIFSSLTCLF